MKSVLLFSFLLGGGTGWAAANLVSSDRFLLKILDQTVSLQDFQYQTRNLNALQCVYEDAFIVQYFEKKFIEELELFLKNFPKTDEEVSRYMQQHTDLLHKARHFFKVLRYAEDQKLLITPKLTDIIHQGTKENKCDSEILHKDTLKTNFQSLLRMELYLRSRYAGQLKNSNQDFKTIRPSIDLFVESLDKQFAHEYFW